MTPTGRDLAGSLIPLERHHPDVCSTCGDVTSDPHRTCGNCRRSSAALGIRPVPVEAVSLYTRTHPLRDVVTNYKNPNSAERQDTDLLIELLHRWVHRHRERLDLDGPIDGCVVVPSTRTRPSVLHHALTANPIPGLGQPVDALIANPRTTPARTPHPQLFRRTGKRIVLIDDVYVSGSTAQSAAHLLTSPGTSVAYVLVAGRRINPAAIAQHHGLEHPAFPIGHH